MSKLDEIRKKLNDSVSQALKKLPFVSKGGSDEDDDYSDKTAEYSTEEIGQIDTDPSLGDNLDIEDDEDKGIRKSLNKKMIIRIVLALTIILLAADQYLSTPSKEDEILKNLPKAKKRKKKRKNRKNNKKKVEKIAEKADKKPVVKKEVVKSTKKPSLEVSDIPKNIGDTLDPNKKFKQDQTEENVMKLEPSAKDNINNNDELMNLGEESKPVVEKLEKPIGDASGIPPETPAEPLAINSEKVLEKKENTKITEEKPSEEQNSIKSPPVKSNTTSPLEVGESKNESGLEALTDINQKPLQKSIGEKLVENVKEEQKTSYTAPPDYERVGRGLVYNCNDRHWACVDKKAYFQCRGNYNWAKSNNKKPECAIKNVYRSVKDCHTVQNYYIDNLENMPDCSE